MENWAGSFEFASPRIHRPSSVDEVRDLVASARRVKAAGTRHSFQPIADTKGDLVSTENLNRILSLDAYRRRVTVEPGVTYGELGAYLEPAGLALPNYASLPHISVGGACATATHGSGDRRGSLATSVAEMELVVADGRVATFTGQELHASAVHLGALGIVTKLTLSVVPAFDIRQSVFEGLSFEAVAAEFDAVFSAGTSVSLFTDWRQTEFRQVWVKQAASDPLLGKEFFGARPAEGERHPIEGISAENCTAQRGVPGPSYERLPHFRLDFTPSCGEELQSEYVVPRECAVEALGRIQEIREMLAPYVLTSEVRSIAADPHWMSPFFERAGIGIHFTWRKDPAAVRALLPRIEAALEPFHARPHWGKLFSTAPDRIRSLYPRRRDFVNVAESLDPEGKFRNAFLDRNVFGKDSQ